MTAVDTPLSSRKRRLWELSTSAHALLLAMALPPALLRSTVAKTIGRLHRATCRLAGSDADVLYSTVHDMAQRNALSEALHKLLDQRHARAVQRLHAVRDEQGLRAAWCAAAAAPDAADLPGQLWALLTHPRGAALEAAALRDAHHWTFALAHRALAAQADSTAQARQIETSKADLQRTQVALQQAQAQALTRASADALALAQLRGELARALAPVPCGAKVATTSGHDPNHVSIRSIRSIGSIRSTAKHSQALRPEPMHTSTLTAAPLQAPRPSTPPPPPAIAGQRVLCVGGMPGAQSRYREIVESVGARFAFHDGGIEDSVQRLDQQLGAADVVVCQAGCLNHEAYRRVKGHCRRLDKPCLYVERPSLTQFARTLGVAA